MYIYICEHADQIITHTVASNYSTWRYSCLIHSQLETVNVLLLLWYYELLTKSCGVWDILIFTINVCLKPAVQTLCIVSCLPQTHLSPPLTTNRIAHSFNIFNFYSTGNAKCWLIEAHGKPSLAYVNSANYHIIGLSSCLRHRTHMFRLNQSRILA